MKRNLSLCLLLLTLVTGCSGCTGTVSAYKAAQSPDEYAYVLSEHYASLVTEAANLSQRPGTPPQAIAVMREADRLAKPVVLSLRDLAMTYTVTKSPKDAAELQKAIDAAVLRIASFVRAVKAARSPPAARADPWPLVRRVA